MEQGGSLGLLREPDCSRKEVMSTLVPDSSCWTTVASWPHLCPTSELLPLLRLTSLSQTSAAITLALAYCTHCYFASVNLSTFWSELLPNCFWARTFFRGPWCLWPGLSSCQTGDWRCLRGRSLAARFSKTVPSTACGFASEGFEPASSISTEFGRTYGSV